MTSGMCGRGSRGDPDTQPPAEHTYNGTVDRRVELRLLDQPVWPTLRASAVARVTPASISVPPSLNTNTPYPVGTVHGDP